VSIGSPVAVLFFHGFLGSPQEYYPIQQVLTNLNVKHSSVTLLGHGASSQQTLWQLNAEELFPFALDAYYCFLKQCQTEGVDQVLVVGHSLGALLALWLAAQQPKGLQGVVSLSCPYQYAYTANYQRGWLCSMGLLSLLKGLWYLPHSISGYNRPSVPWYKLKRLTRQAPKLFLELQQALPDITTPVWLAHSPYDLTVPYAEMQKLNNMLGDKVVETLTLTRCGHQIYPHSQESQQVTRWIISILQHLIPFPVIMGV
jgi:carboxylesterase